MSGRYAAAPYSEDPRLGVLVDKRMRRFALFPSPDHAERAASRLSECDAPPCLWRSMADGEPIEPTGAEEAEMEAKWAAVAEAGVAAAEAYEASAFKFLDAMTRAANEAIENSRPQ